MSATKLWTDTLFKEVCVFTSKPKGFHLSKEIDVPFVPMELIPERTLYSSNHLLKSPDSLTSGTYFEEGDVLLAKITPCFENGKQTILSNLPQGFGFATTEVIPFKERSGVSDKEFLFFYLLRHDVRATLAAKMEGTTGRQRLNKNSLENLFIVLPSLREQMAIAQVLKTVFRAKEARQREFALERERKAALMEHLFTHGTRGETTKQSEIGEIPESWTVTPLNQIADLYSGGTPSKARPEWWKGSIPWVSTKDLKKPRLSDVTDHITEEAVQEGSRLVPANSLFVGIRGMILAKGIPVCLATVPMAFNQDVKAVVPREGISPDFLLYAMNFFKSALNRHVGTSAHGTKRIGGDAIAMLGIPFPLAGEQELIANALSACDEKLVALSREQRLLSELFNALLEELMTGRVGVAGLIDGGSNE